ncbi:uncharacterized protein [Amphiura filiformis]|uniref:uncharacterized protein n=1 Tax=Amphiura filiformis TaxID=82378 RepID=UPI003B22547D
MVSFVRSSSSSSGTEHKENNLQWNTCRRRKSSRPQRSATRNDPLFRGVTFSVETRISGGNKDVRKTGPKIMTQLHITSFFSVRKKDRCQGGFWHRKKHHSVNFDSSSGGSDQDVPAGGSPTFGHRFPEYIPGLGKMCASCGTKRTPLWRDAEDGTPLCNACGIRYKKYRVRCVHCWHIPKKDGKSYPNCARCGDALRMTLPRRVQFF